MSPRRKCFLLFLVSAVLGEQHGSSGVDLEPEGSMPLYYDSNDSPARDNGCAVKPNVYYYIYSHDSNMVVDLGDDDSVIQRKQSLTNPRDSAEWYLRNVEEDDSSKYFYVINKLSNKYLGVIGESRADGASFQQGVFTGKTDQQFEFASDRYAFCRIVAGHSAKVLTSNDNATKSNTRLVQNRAQHWNGQRWRMVEVDCDPHPDQLYHIERREDSSALRASSPRRNGLELTADTNGAENTKFTFSRVIAENAESNSSSRLLYKVRLGRGDRVLRIDADQRVSLTTADEKDDGERLFELVRKAGNHACEIKNVKYDKLVSITNAQTGAIGTAPLEDKHLIGTEWRLIPSEFELHISPTAVYRIRNRQTGFYIDIGKGSARRRQLFRFKRVAKQRDVYQIGAADTSLVFDARNVSAGVLQNVSNENDPWQMFKLINLWREKNPNPLVLILSVMSEKALMPRSNDGKQLDVVQTSTDYENKRQHWEIIRKVE